MPSYYYRARDMNGQAHEGVEVASSEDEVLRILERSQLIPVLIETRSGESTNGAGTFRLALPRLALGAMRRPIKPAAVALFARQLATMIGAGLPLVRSLRSISRDHYDRRLAGILDMVADDVQKGETLSTALGKHSDTFDEVFVSLIHTGEISGTLDRIMEQTATYLERAETLRLKVEAALRYPIFVFCFAGVVLLAMLLKIIPMFSEIYSRFKVPLPLPTRILLGLSQLVTSHLLIAALFTAVAAITAINAARTDAGRLWVDRTKFSLPLFGGLIRMYSVTKFARTLGILTASGTQILYALKVIRPVPGNRVLEIGIDRVRSRVEQGVSLSRAMGEAEVFPEMLVQMTATGEETGQLDGMLLRTAEFYEQRVTSAVDGLSSLVEPIAIVVLGALVGLMLVALYLPIFSLGQAMRSGMLGH